MSPTTRFAVYVLAVVAALASVLLAWRGFTSGPAPAPHIEQAYTSDYAGTPTASPLTQPASDDGYPCADQPVAGRIVIPQLCISADISNVGSRDGEMVIPTDVRTVGIFNEGSGLFDAEGTTIIAGHVDTVGQGPGSLYNLHKVEAGTIVYTSDPSGASVTWRVVSLTEIHKSALPGDIFSTTGPRQLVIVTCGGKIRHTASGAGFYEDNILAYAVPVT